MCRHFEENGCCPLGKLCSFAHGKGELREMKDPLPKEALNNYSVYLPYSNYKTVRCKNFESPAGCTYGAYCTFAHGLHERRSLYDPIVPNVPMMQGTMPYP